MKILLFMGGKATDGSCRRMLMSHGEKIRKDNQENVSECNTRKWEGDNVKKSRWIYQNIRGTSDKARTKERPQEMCIRKCFSRRCLCGDTDIAKIMIIWRYGEYLRMHLYAWDLFSSLLVGGRLVIWCWFFVRLELWEWNDKMQMQMQAM